MSERLTRPQGIEQLGFSKRDLRFFFFFCYYQINIFGGRVGREDGVQAC